MSITREQFQLQIDRLEDTFGERFFPDQRTHMMWESAIGYNYNTVIAVVDSFIRSSKAAPMPSDFSSAMNEATRETRRKFALGELQPKEQAQCFDCADSGFVRLKRNEQFEKWANWQSGSAPCHCHRGRMAIDAAKRKPKNPIDLGSQFSDRWLNSYSIVQAYPLEVVR